MDLVNIPIERQIALTYTPTGDSLIALVAAPEYTGRGEAVFLAKSLESRRLKFATIPTEKSRESPFCSHC